MDLLIIGNCQIQPISEWIKLNPNIGKVWTLPVHLYGNEVFKKFEEDYSSAMLSDTLTIMSQPLSSEFGIYSTEQMRSAFPHNYFTFTNFHFSGLHPDITYLGLRGQRVASPLGDYHSKIIIGSYVSGLSEKACLERFSDEQYESLGYYDEYNSSVSELIKRAGSRIKCNTYEGRMLKWKKHTTI